MAERKRYMTNDNVIYCLVEREMKISQMNHPLFLAKYLDNGYTYYYSAEDAERGRQNGDAYDDPGKTRVVGFRVMPFLPKKKRVQGKGKVLKKANPLNGSYKI